VVGEPLARQRDFVAACLHAEGLLAQADAEPALVAGVSERLDACLHAELLPGLRLGALAPTQLRAEMSFHFALDGAAMSTLRRACARHGAEDLLPSHLPAAALVGQMTGKIDLVLQHAGRFHVLDYKSNFLGERLDDYAPARLDAAMDAHAYRFQALLYSVALQRYLRQRLPDYSAAVHLGDVLYLFVRAVGVAPGAGVWRQRFDPALLDAVDAVLGGAGAQA
jgi:exodeoxyribonuclease V beta subunit